MKQVSNAENFQITKMFSGDLLGLHIILHSCFENLHHKIEIGFFLQSNITADKS